MGKTNVYNVELIREDKSSGFSDRVLMILKQQKRTKTWLAEEIGVTKQGMNYILEKSSKKLINEIALALDVSPQWLETGEGSYSTNSATREDIIYLPLISFENIVEKNIDPKTQDKHIIASSNLSELCFAVTLDNTSMEPLFKKGSILIFDPDKSPKSGDYVIFSLSTTEEVFFRQFFKEGNDTYLKAVDIMYKVITSTDISILGTLVESRNCFS